MGFVAMVAALPTRFRIADDTSAQHKHEGVAVYLLQRWRGVRNNLGFILIPQGAELLLWQILKDFLMVSREPELSSLKCCQEGS